MTNRVVVMGGSFNPPTRAHLQLMEAALEAVDARGECLSLRRKIMSQGR